MNRIRTLLGKDLRRFRPALLGWSCLIALKLLVGLCLLQGWGASEQALAALRMLIGALLVGEHVGLFLLTVFIVQCDAPSDPGAFWKCRPVSGALLLGSKLLFLSLALVVWPILLHLPWWLWCGFQPGQVGWAAVDVVIANSALVVLALGGAVLTRSVLKFVLGNLAAAIVLFILVVFAEALLGSSEVYSRFLLAGVLGSAGVIAVCVTSYLVRNVWIPRFCAAGTILLLAAVFHWGPRSGQAERLRESVQAQLLRLDTQPVPPELKMEVVGAEVQKGRGWGGKEKIQLSLRGNRLAGLPFAEVRVHLRLRWPDGTHVAASGGEFQSDVMERDDRRRFGEPPWVTATVGIDNLRVTFELPTEFAARLQHAPAEAELSLLLIQPGFRERSMALGRAESVARGGGYRLVKVGETIRLVRHVPLLWTEMFLRHEFPLDYWTSFWVVTSDGSFKWTLDPGGQIWRIEPRDGLEFLVGSVGIDLRGVRRRGVSVKPNAVFVAADLAPGDQLVVAECWPGTRWSMTKRMPAFRLSPPAQGE